MDQHEEQLELIEISITKAQEDVARADALHRLHSNADFKKIIFEGYFRDEASRAVLLKADPNVQGEKEQRHIERIITSIGGLHQYFGTIYQMGNNAQRALAEDKAAREEILQEQLSEGTVQ